MDTESLALLNQLHPKLRAIAIEAWEQAVEAMPANVMIKITQTYRTFAQSDALYAQGRTTPGQIVTNAKAGQSYHNYALAFDFSMTTNGKADWTVGPNWMEVVGIMGHHGFTWGGNFAGSFKDAPHFEMTFGHNWRDLLALHNAGKFIPGTTYVQI